jgi:hypothetical protein
MLEIVEGGGDWQPPITTLSHMPSAIFPARKLSKWRRDTGQTPGSLLTSYYVQHTVVCQISFLSHIKRGVGHTIGRFHGWLLNWSRRVDN